MKPTDSESPREALFPLRAAPFWGPGLMGAVMVGGVFTALFVGPELADLSTADQILWLAVTLSIMIGGMVGWRLLGWRPQPSPVVLREEGLLLGPAGVFGRQTELPWDAILELEVQRGPVGDSLFLDTRRGVFVVAAVELEQPERFPELWGGIRQRFREGEAGAERVRRVHARQKISAGLLERPARAYLAVLGGLALVYVIEMVVGALDGVAPSALIAMGASVPYLVAEGEYFRLFTAPLLHGSALHLGMNAFAIVVLSPAVERLMGPWRFLLVYLGGALGGAAASAFFSEGLASVGASSAVFGLLGALGVGHLRYRSALPAGFRQSRTWWFVVLGLNFGISSLPMVDGLAHLGGFVAGALLGAALLWGEDEMLSRPLPAGLLTLAGASLLLAMTLASATVAGRQLLHDQGAAGRRLYVALAEDPEAGPERLNQVAWYLGVDRRATQAELEIGLTAARRAVSASQQEPSFIDTEAQLLHRLGRRLDAVSRELDAFAQLPVPTFATQLGRFLAAYYADAGVYRRGPLPEGLTVELGILPRAPGERVSGAGYLIQGAASTEAFEVISLIQMKGRNLGVAVYCVGPAPEGRREHSLTVSWAQLNKLSRESEGPELTFLPVAYLAAERGPDGSPRCELSEGEVEAAIFPYTSSEAVLP